LALVVFQFSIILPDAFAEGIDRVLMLDEKGISFL